MKISSTSAIVIDMRPMQNIESCLKKNGMIVTGESNGLIEAVEVADHPWFLGVQFHPEFTSRLQSPNLAILAFIKASMKI